MGFTFSVSPNAKVTARDSFLCFGFVTKINNLYFLCPENCSPHLEIQIMDLPSIRLARCNHLATPYPDLATTLSSLVTPRTHFLSYANPFLSYANLFLSYATPLLSSDTPETFTSHLLFLWFSAVYHRVRT
jgi:hypothetical protein